jgi:hypothetical protein
MKPVDHVEIIEMGDGDVLLRAPNGTEIYLTARIIKEINEKNRNVNNDLMAHAINMIHG